MKNTTIIYQAENGAIEFKNDSEHETFWANLDQISSLFGRDKSVISRHLKNIFSEEELEKKSTVAFFATVQREGNRDVSRNIEYFNLDVLISVGYRVNSKIATKFRKWATQTLKQHITKGYTINPARLEQNKKLFLQAMKDIKALSKENSEIKTENILELVQTFANTWFSLESFDKQQFPQKNKTQDSIDFDVNELYADIKILKQELLSKNEATELFAQEKNKNSLKGIFGNVMQEAFGERMYPSIEEKAAHFLYFIVKNHVFNDGNKRTGAFTFLWFLQKSGYNFEEKISPSALTALTLLIAQSNPKEKEKMIGLILLLLQ